MLFSLFNDFQKIFFLPSLNCGMEEAHIYRKFSVDNIIPLFIVTSILWRLNSKLELQEWSNAFSFEIELIHLWSQRNYFRI